MMITIEAVVENGLLRPMQPLPLQENELVRITIEKKSDWAERTYGLCGWKGDPKELERLALSPDFDLEEEEDLERQLDQGDTASPKDWRAVAGMFTDSEFSRQVDEEALKIRQADREATRLDLGE